MHWLVTEAEYIALSEAVKKGTYLWNLLHELGFTQGTTSIYVDNSGARLIAKGAGSARSKHFDIRLKHVQDVVKNAQFEVQPIATADNVSDIFTKALSRQVFEGHRDMLVVKFLGTNHHINFAYALLYANSEECVKEAYTVCRQFEDLYRQQKGPEVISSDLRNTDPHHFAIRMPKRKQSNRGGGRSRDTRMRAGDPNFNRNDPALMIIEDKETNIPGILFSDVVSTMVPLEVRAAARMAYLHIEARYLPMYLNVIQTDSYLAKHKLPKLNEEELACIKDGFIPFRLQGDGIYRYGLSKEIRTVLSTEIGGMAVRNPPNLLCFDKAHPYESNVHDIVREHEEYKVILDSNRDGTILREQRQHSGGEHDGEEGVEHENRQAAQGRIHAPPRLHDTIVQSEIQTEIQTDFQIHSQLDLLMGLFEPEGQPSFP